MPEQYRIFPSQRHHVKQSKHSNYDALWPNLCATLTERRRSMYKMFKRNPTPHHNNHHKLAGYLTFRKSNAPLLAAFHLQAIVRFQIKWFSFLISIKIYKPIIIYIRNCVRHFDVALRERDCFHSLFNISFWRTILENRRQRMFEANEESINDCVTSQQNDRAQLE